MQPTRVRKWSDYNDVPLTEEAIRQCFQPADEYRVTLKRYPAETQFDGTMRQGTIFVVEGVCKIAFEGDSAPCELMVSAGEFVEVPGGNYELLVTGPGDLTIVCVWRLVPT